MNDRINFLAHIACLLLLVGCGVYDDGTIRNMDGRIVVGDPAHVREAQRRMLEGQYPDPEVVPPTGEGGTVFDGLVSSLTIEENGLHITKFDVQEILYGNLDDANEVTIYSPSPLKGGVDFQIGKKYRVFTAKIQDKYRTWNWTGTVELGLENNQ
jgi:hypothetical protein